MIRNLSQDTIRELFAESSGSAMLPCITINHSSMAEPARVVANTKNITFNGFEYQAIAFSAALPSDTESKIPSVQIKLDNVSRLLVELLRSIDSPADMTMDIVRVSQQGVITREIGPLNFVLLNCSINLQQVILNIGYAHDLLNEPATSEILSPSIARGLF